jgi:hypothetical protein
MTDKTLEEIASDAADTAGPDDATAPVVAEAEAAPGTVVSKPTSRRR